MAFFVIDMGKILAIDYGIKRCGIAITDSLQLIASGLTTVETKVLAEYMKEILTKEDIGTLVIGEPKRLDGELSEIETKIVPFIQFLKRNFPQLKVEREDERFTSKMAFQSMIDGGLKKKQRQDKALIDKVSATIILQSYLNRQG